MKTLKALGELCLIFVLLFLLMYANGCKERRHYSKKTHQTVKVYKQHNPKYVAEKYTSGSSDDNEWIYWYIIDYNNTYYYYTSPNLVPSSSYSTFNWSTAKANVESPITEVSKELQSVEEQTISNDELGSQMEQTIDTTEQQIADMVDEGNPNSGGYDTDSNDSGSTDSGSSGDSGGGDSGGGDGGGGGD